MMTNPICQIEMCTGCSACFSVCPTKCIEMRVDDEGFLFPFIDERRCTDCGMCKEVCPVLNPLEIEEYGPLVFACWNKDERTRYKSTSGGAFPALATSVIERGGVVSGAAFDRNMRVHHIIISKEEELQTLSGSKYVQSDLENTFSEIEVYLEKGIEVLFSGTPCQVAGLKRYIGKRFDNLITIDILCRGVPSPGLFAEYIDFLERKLKKNISRIDFRDKKYGWGISLTRIDLGDDKPKYIKGILNSFMYGFDEGYYMRRSCYQCLFSRKERYGDITLGDFWGIGNDRPFNYPRKNGISFLKVNSKLGHDLFIRSQARLLCEERSLHEAINGQGSALKKPIDLPKTRSRFFNDHLKMTYFELASEYLVEEGIKGKLKKFVPISWQCMLRKLIRRQSGAH